MDFTRNVTLDEYRNLLVCAVAKRSTELHRLVIFTAINCQKMWREEAGCFEMLLAYFSTHGDLFGTRSYRDCLLDILCYHETNLSLSPYMTKENDESDLNGFEIQVKTENDSEMVESTEIHVAEEKIELNECATIGNNEIPNSMDQGTRDIPSFHTDIPNIMHQLQGKQMVEKSSMNTLFEKEMYRCGESSVPVRTPYLRQPSRSQIESFLSGTIEPVNADFLQGSFAEGETTDQSNDGLPGSTGMNISSKSVNFYSSQPSNEIPITCSYCSRRFCRLRDKLAHEKKHTLARPYACTYCPRTFADCSNRRRHERTHTNDRPHKCSYCSKAFIRLDSKTNHEKIHTPLEKVISETISPT